MENAFYLDKLTLTNFRQFETLTVQFKQGINVLIGLNGSGKTGILQAIRIGLACVLDNHLEVEIHCLDFITNDDIKIGCTYGEVITNFKLIKDSKETAIEWKAKITNNSKYLDVAENYTPLDLSKSDNVPILIYIGIDIFGVSVQDMFKDKKVTNSIYKNALNYDAAKFSDFIQWYIAEEGFEDYKRLEIDNEYKNVRLEILRKAFATFFSHLNTVLFDKIRVKKEYINANPNLEFKNNVLNYLTFYKDKEVFKIEQLPTGQKMLLMLVADITRRLIIANPNSDTATLGTGVVLIDEIDLHLHPKWQREVLPALAATFPNIQFIVTTHSPQVLSKIEHDRIILLEDNQAMTLQCPTYGRDANSILMEVFGVSKRPEEIQQKIEQCFLLLDQEEWEKAKILLNALQIVLGETDPDIVRATTIYDFYN